MRRRRLRIRPLSIVLVLGCVASLSAHADVSLDLSADPTAVPRGGTVRYEVRVRNDGPGTIAGTTLSMPLPAGLDQWSCDVRVGGGAWEPYPPNGLLAMAPLPAGDDRLFEIRAPVELGAPGTLPTTAQVLDPTGPLAEGFVEVNVLPSVDAGPDVIAEFGGSVTLVGAAAGDGGSGLAAIEWSDGGAGGTFDDPSILHVTYTPAPVSGVIELTLRVVDGGGGSAEDSLRVRVNAPPIVDAGEDRSAVPGASVSLDDATASDVDGWIVAYDWSDGGGGGTFLPAADGLHPTYAVPALDGCSDAVVELTLTATDDWGGTGVDALLLTVAGVNRPPDVEAGPDQTAEPDATVVLAGEASDEDGGVLAVSWEQLAGPEVDLAGARSADARFVAPPSDGGTRLVFRLRAVDPCGAEASDDVAVVVLPGGGSGAVEGGEGALAVAIRAFDAWGLPLSPLDVLADGSDVRLVVEATNVGEETLTGLEGSSDVEGRFPFPGGSLDPWERASGSFVHRIDASLLEEGESRVTVDVRASGPGGETVCARGEIAFLVDRPAADVSLEKTADRTEAAVGETVTYAYTIRNDGGAVVSDLALVDDRLGQIPLPRTSVEPGEMLVATWAYTIRETDLPGPLTNSAVLSGFGFFGAPVRAASVASIEVLPSAGGAGGVLSDAGRSVVISEIAWAGTRADPAAEWIELANVAAEPIDLSGWSLRWRGEAPDDDWRTVELSGTIDPLPAALVGSVDGSHRLASAPQGEGWRIYDVSWERIGEAGASSRGFYVLERGSDSTLRDVAADLVYDRELRRGLDLPDGGTTLLLVSPDGTIVDSANASSRFGWAAGEARSAATMERVNLLRGDEDGNWQTSPGILTSGRDAFGDRVTGTAGMPNSPSLEALTAFAASDVPVRRVVSATSIPIPLERSGEAPRIRVTVAGGAAAGGGAAASVIRITTRRTEDGRWIDLDPTEWPTGTICVWVVDSEGEAFLLSLARGT